MSTTASLTSRKLAKAVAELAKDKKAIDVAILDVKKIANFCDYFVICSGSSDRQVRAIALGIEDGLKKQDVKIGKIQGLETSIWVLVDLGDVVIHIFQPEAREFYGLEHLWQEAKKVE